SCWCWLSTTFLVAMELHLRWQFMPMHLPLASVTDHCVAPRVGSRPICHTCAATTCGSRVGWEARRLDILSRSSPRSSAPQCVISLGMTEPALSCRTAAPGQLVLWPSQLVGGWQTG